MSAEEVGDINPLGVSDALELVLELARRRFRHLRRQPTRREASRLYDQAALEQLDYLLMEHWEVIDAIARRRAAADAVGGRLVWRVRSGVLVEQRPAEAVGRCLDLADQQLRDAGPGRDGSAADAISLGRRFLARHGNELDARFGRSSA
ncbi:hypothetical protein M0534_04405 [Methylonatrum kenyense]|uniref:hypothetical protein n=1 Tax=Methylonatrum kenyense TaxID=455253 RepID=UPI0020BFFFB9|nr:hypothetical protein [Methylonatrum kenyense]MCK8515570.1 hypothetical protein [Methylonatrum kenyense]